MKRKRDTQYTVPASALTLTPDPANPNRMAAEDKARMAASLAEFGECGELS
jgi:hypothetical protein